MSTHLLPPTVGLVLHFRHHVHTVSCLNSLLTEGIEHVLLVDNSEDGGRSLCQVGQHLDDLNSRGMAVELYQPGRNLGFSAGVNRGLEAIAEQHGSACVLLINNDARLAGQAHARLRRILEEGAAIAAAEMHTSSNERIRSLFYHRSTGLLLRHRLLGSYPYCSGCCLLIGPTLSACPLFDEDFFFYGEDTELGWRLSALGVSVRWAEGAVVEHALSTGSHNGSLFYEYHIARAHWLLAGKLATGGLENALFLTIRAFTLPMRALWRATRQGSLLPLKALFMATVDVLQGRLRTLTPPA